jgi:hypothetical protein
MSVPIYALYYVGIADGEGWIRSPWRKIPSLKYRWQHWERLETSTNLSAVLHVKISIFKIELNPFQ